MHPLTILNILGLLLGLFSLTMVLPMGVALLYREAALVPFATAFAMLSGTGLVLWLATRGSRSELRLRDGFVVVVLFWVVLGISGGVPLYLLDGLEMSLVDAVFESISGLTTTGATVLTGIDELPKAVLFYRQLLQWLGGMGIIVLAVAILPVLGVGGMQLYRAETPGPLKENKLTPRITETAKNLWYIYLGLTAACGVAYWAVGMEPFDALAHSFSTVAIGGFSTHDASLGYFDSPLVELTAVLFMMLAGMNFALHFSAWRTRSIRVYALDTECRTYLWFLGIAIALTSFTLYVDGLYANPLEALRSGGFQAVSFATTTGFTTGSYALWPGFLPVVLIFSSFVGGCAGSTGGGMKVIRVLLLFKQGARETLRLIHPNAMVAIKLGSLPLSGRVMDAVWGFFAAYVFTFAALMMGLMMTGLDQVTAFSAVAACLNNLGPGLGEVAANYSSITPAGKWLLALAMLLGRLEIFTLLVVLSPAFWRT